MEGSETQYARMLEACAMGASVQASIADVTGFDPGSAMTPEYAAALSEACETALDVAHSFGPNGIEDMDVDPSWVALRRSRRSTTLG